jgi:hypothetical protein
MPFFIVETKDVPGCPEPVPVVEGLGKWQAQGDWPKREAGEPSPDAGKLVIWSAIALPGLRAVTEWPNGTPMIEGECRNIEYDGEPEPDARVLRQLALDAAASAYDKGDLFLTDGMLSLKPQAARGID